MTFWHSHTVMEPFLKSVEHCKHNLRTALWYTASKLTSYFTMASGSTSASCSYRRCQTATLGPLTASKLQLSMATVAEYFLRAALMKIKCKWLIFGCPRVCQLYYWYFCFLCSGDGWQFHHAMISQSPHDCIEMDDSCLYFTGWEGKRQLASRYATTPSLDLRVLAAVYPPKQSTTSSTQCMAGDKLVWVFFPFDVCRTWILAIHCLSWSRCFSLGLFIIVHSYSMYHLLYLCNN